MLKLIGGRLYQWDLGRQMEVHDPDGNLIELKAVTKQEKNGRILFRTSWMVTGRKGNKLEYTVRVKDANGAVSVNQETVSITIK